MQITSFSLLHTVLYITKLGADSEAISQCVEISISECIESDFVLALKVTTGEFLMVSSQETRSCHSGVIGMSQKHRNSKGQSNVFLWKRLNGI